MINELSQLMSAAGLGGIVPAGGLGPLEVDCSGGVTGASCNSGYGALCISQYGVYCFNTSKGAECTATATGVYCSGSATKGARCVGVTGASCSAIVATCQDGAQGVSGC